jgi:hypothetical protein
MKFKLTKFLAIAALSLITSFSSSAQVVDQGTSHIFLGIGYPNIPGLVYTTFGAGGGTSLGPICFSYQYGLSSKFTLGGTFNYSSATTTSLEGYDINNNPTSYKLTLSLMTIMATGNYHYLSSDKFDLYSGISFGYGIASAGISGNAGVGGAETIVSVGGVAWHANAIGVRLMFTEHIGAYAEFGYGWNGLAQFGLSSKF